MESLDSREAVAGPRARAARGGRVPRRAVGRRRPPGLPARLARDARARSLDWTPRAARALTPLTVRLVKGAYWDHEVVEARQHGWSAAGVRGQGRLRPQLRALTRALLDARPARARRRSHPTTCARSRTRSPADRALGGGDRRPRAPGPARARRRPPGRARASGLRVRTYCPVGDLVAGHGLPRAAAAREHEQRRASSRARPRACRSRSCSRRRELGRDSDAVRQRAACSSCAARRSRDALRARSRASTPSCRCGCRCWSAASGARATSSSRPTPAAPDRVVALAPLARRRTTSALARRRRGAGAPRGRDDRRRAGRRRSSRAAALLRERRLELAALAVRECAKPWAEADADVCEAIDFLEYYARGAVELEPRAPLLQVARRAQRAALRPRGVAAVISPWNFPLAIPLGMTAAALAAGNAVVLKPAEQSPGCARDARRGAARGGRAAGGAARSLPGEGDAGAALVRDPRVAHDRLHRLRPGRARDRRTAAEVARRPARTLKRVVAEMGGKNCVIVDSDADLDEAVPAIVRVGVRLRAARSARRPRACSCTRRSPTR